LLHAPADLPLRRRLIERGGGGESPSAAVIEHKRNLFLELMRWAEGGSCRHDAILRYFGDEAETLAGCGRCDVCLDLGESAGDEEETTLVVRKALSAVARIHRRFGLTAAVKLLAGVADPRLERAGLQRTPTFGALAGRSEEWLTRVLRRCVTAGFVDFTSGERPVALLTESGRAVMKAERPPRLSLPVEHGPGLTSRPPRGGARKPARGDEELPPEDAPLFEELRRVRLELAREDGVPPFVVASDRTLRDVARLRPRSLEDLQRAFGIGAARAARYGESLLGVVAAHRASRS
jgi:ATP-dependent DNA helicase RecQ